MGGPSWRAIASLAKFFRGPPLGGPTFLQILYNAKTDFIGYSKENLKIHTGLPSPPFPLLPSLPLIPLPLPPTPSPPSPPFIYPPSLRSRAP